MSLTEFLLARIVEDEAAARAAARYSSDWVAADEFHETLLLAADDQFGHTIDSAYGEVVPHIARHDPARVLAECEAKRRIVDDHDMVHECPSGPNLISDPSSPNEGGYGGPCGTLMALSLPYADRPDYDPDWRP